MALKLKHHRIQDQLKQAKMTKRQWQMSNVRTKMMIQENLKLILNFKLISIIFIRIKRWLLIVVKI